MSNVQVKISTASLLIDKIDKIIEEGYFQNRTEALNEEIRFLIKKYQLAKIKTRIETMREDTEKYPELSGIVESMHSEEELFQKSFDGSKIIKRNFEIKSTHDTI